MIETLVEDEAIIMAIKHYCLGSFDCVWNTVNRFMPPFEHEKQHLVGAAFSIHLEHSSKIACRMFP